MISRASHVAGSRRRTVATVLAVALGVLCGAPASAIVYHGQPDLALTSAVVAAGGGPSHFSSQRLFAAVTGPLEAAEAEKLTKQFGAAGVTSTFAVFDYAIDDSLRIATEKHIALPPPSPSPATGKALGLALYAAGVTTTGKWDVGYMLERLISHPIHHTVMHDIDAKFGPSQNETFHIVLAQMMDDLAVAYHNAK